MFGRNAFFRLKSIDRASEFKQTFQEEVLPLLRKQKGFVGEIILANPGSLEKLTISLWENSADAAAYERSIYPQVLKILAKTIDGTPKVRTYESATLTLHNGAT